MRVLLTINVEHNVKFDDDIHVTMTMVNHKDIIDNKEDNDNDDDGDNDHDDKNDVNR